jgi:multidrug transporter EmrE-like cation transporter
MHWVLLALGIGIEILASASLRLSDGFTKIGYAGLTLVCFAVAFFIISQVVRTMPLGVAYSFWVGGGIVSVTLMGAVVFGQSLDGYAYLGIGLILAGTVVLNGLSSAANC